MIPPLLLPAAAAEALSAGGDPLGAPPRTAARLLKDTDEAMGAPPVRLNALDEAAAAEAEAAAAEGDEEGFLDRSDSSTNR